MTADTRRPGVVDPGAAPADLDLLEQIRAGHAIALDVLLHRYWAPLVAYAARLAGGADAAEDVAQEAFVRLWERRESWTPRGCVRALLYQIVRNLALDERKSRTRREARVGAWPGDAAREPTPADHLQGAELEAAFEIAIAALPDRRREVFVLVRQHGLSYQQAAEVMGIAPQTVANQLCAALAELRTALEPFLPDAASPPASTVRNA